MEITNLIGALKDRSDDLISKTKIKDVRASINISGLSKSKTKSLNSEKAKMYEFIGMEVYSLYKTGEVNIEGVEPFCQRIDSINGELALLEAQSSKTCLCGGAPPKNAKFCPSCGKNLSEPVIEEQATVTCVCGAVVENGERMCMECGRRIELM